MQHALGPTRYRILLGGRTIASGEVQTGRVLAVALDRHVEDRLRRFGERIVVDPVFVLPGCWIRLRLAAKAREAGLVTAAPAEVIALHLQEAVARELAGA